MKAARILIVEDEYKVANFIKQGLEECNFEAEVAHDGKSGREMILKKNYDLIILDLNLPGLPGKYLCRELRQRNISIPVLMLTALGTIEDKLEGFDNGADDYHLNSVNSWRV